MSVPEHQTPEIPPDVLADAQTVAECLARGRSVPPEVARRVQQRAEEGRKQLLAAYGVQNIGVQIIREIRGELPES